MRQIWRMVYDILIGGGGRRHRTREGGEECVKSVNQKTQIESCFKMPIHYPRYKKSDYENMDEWKLDNLLHQYGLFFSGNLEKKRAFAITTFLWPNQL
ncbi:hypothetical protein ABFS82_13G135800 [Erythranthe guttata]